MDKEDAALPQPKTLVYGDHPSQFIDVYRPEGAGPHPVVVLIHGGFWRLPWGRDLMRALAADLVARGFAAVNVEYRRLGEAGGGWPGTCEDVASALRALVGAGGGVTMAGPGELVGAGGGVAATAPGELVVAGGDVAATGSGKLVEAGGDVSATGPGEPVKAGSDVAGSGELDLSRLGLVGHSAGGHLALWAGKHAPLPVRLVVSQAGVADLRSAARDRLDGDVAGRLPAAVEFMGGEPADLLAAYHLASPIELLPLGPSVHQLVVHGDADDRVPFQQSADYVEAAQAAGDSVELAAFTGMGHFELIDPAHESWIRTAAELARRLGA